MFQGRWFIVFDDKRSVSFRTGIDSLRSNNKWKYNYRIETIPNRGMMVFVNESLQHRVVDHGRDIELSYASSFEGKDKLYVFRLCIEIESIQFLAFRTLENSAVKWTISGLANLKPDQLLEPLRQIIEEAMKCYELPSGAMDVSVQFSSKMLIRYCH